MNMKDLKISVIMPVLNEEKGLEKKLRSLNLTESEELIIVDGGSSDRTVEIASDFTELVYCTQSGRARQMNLGARKAGGDILLFLHADCILPEHAFQIIRATLSRNNTVAGAFDLSIDSPSPCFRVIERGANIRSRITRTPYGDQGIFMIKDTFEELGGYADIPIMEDIEIARRLNKKGGLALIRQRIKASPRRWQKEGLFYTSVRDWALALAYTVFHVSPERLIKYYRRDVR
ncbi:N-glycosyltransferase [bacterium BMS3Bbin06]|nr:N-glycosyltransferase [bacterium BMS3Abin08]GBE34314.1 N-glycosyltransferase [bacterium BMS3Bbin06]HDO34961.1 glycosyltransferase [Nitrospirota bacterium]HDY71298.1 glycosyltransferase [Nitrospirota bacterium]